MKKILTILCAGLLMTSPLAILAEGPAEQVDETNNYVTEDSDANVKLYAEVTSTYSVKIPKEFDVTLTETNLKIYAKGDISADEKLSISYQKDDVALKEVSDSATKHDDVALTLTGDNVDLLWNQLLGDYEENPNLTINIKHAVLAAGYWETNLPITIALTAIA